MKSVVFLKAYFGAIQQGTKANVIDEDYQTWLSENYVQEIEFETDRGVCIKSLADLQIRTKNKDNYHKAKILFGETYKEKNAEDKRCDILSNYIIDEYKIKTIRDGKGDEYWYMHNGVYVPNGKTIIIETAYDFFGEKLSTSVITKIELLTKSKTYIEPSIFFDNIDKKRIGVANGILNLETFELENNPKTQGNIFVRIPVVYDATAKCPNFEAFLENILAKKEHINTIQELLGFCLLPEYKFEKMFIWTGTGRNGKSKLISVFKTFLGASNCTAHSLQTLQNKEFCLAEMHNKLANIGGDISGEALKSTDIVKQITGQDLISANRKFKDYVRFVSFAKQIFACNELPTIYDSSLGFWNRINRLDFPYTFYEEHELKGLSEEKIKFAKLRREDILDNILTPSELSGILNYAIQGLMFLRRSKSFSNAEETLQVRSEWLRRTSSFYSYIEDLYEFDSNAYVPSSYVSELYDLYCQANNLRSIPPNQRAEQIRTFCNKPVSLYRTKSGEDKIYCWKGIKLKAEFEQKLNTNKETLIVFNQKEETEAGLSVLNKLDSKIFIIKKSQTDGTDI
jgi:putative DNA primase/helicase